MTFGVIFIGYQRSFSFTELHTRLFGATIATDADRKEVGVRCDEYGLVLSTGIVVGVGT